MFSHTTFDSFISLIYESIFNNIRVPCSWGPLQVLSFANALGRLWLASCGAVCRLLMLTHVHSDWVGRHVSL